jgi:hypothetical protein
MAMSEGPLSSTLLPREHCQARPNIRPARASMSQSLSGRGAAGRRTTGRGWTYASLGGIVVKQRPRFGRLSGINGTSMRAPPRAERRTVGRLATRWASARDGRLLDEAHRPNSHRTTTTSSRPPGWPAVQRPVPLRRSVTNDVRRRSCARPRKGWSRALTLNAGSPRLGAGGG